jgi:hypothetical protein
MKKTLILCSLISIASAIAQEPESDFLQAAKARAVAGMGKLEKSIRKANAAVANVDDDSDKNNPDGVASISDLSEAIDEMTQDLTELRIQVSVKEQMLNALPAFQQVNFRKGLSMTPEPSVRNLRLGILKTSMAKADYKTIGDYSEDYITAAMHCFDLEYEAMVLTKLDKELESHMKLVAQSKQNPAHAARASQSSDN